MKPEDITSKFQKLGKDRFLLLFLAGIMLIIIAMPMDKLQDGDADGNIKKNGQSSMISQGTETASVQGQVGTDTKASGNGTLNSEAYNFGNANISDLEAYRTNLCKELKQFLQNMEGVGSAEVYITMHSSSEIIVERNSPYSRRNEEELTDGNTRTIAETENDSEVVLVEREDGSMEPIIVKEIVPTVKGIVVAAQGGNNEIVKKNITEMLMALFGIEEHKIRVVKLNT